MKTKTVYDIIWDIDNEEDLDLPSEVEVPYDMDEDSISDYLSDEYGFCHKGFEISDKITDFKTINIDEKTSEWINKLLTMPSCQAGDTESVLYTKTVKFDDGYEVDIKLCNADDESTPWTEAVLFLNGSEVCCTEVEDSFDGIWELETKDKIFVVNVCFS